MNIKAFCINLFERPDRLKSAKELFDKYDLDVEFYQVNRDTNGERGCFTSHVGVMKKAYNAGLDYVMIFEDDITCNLAVDQLHNAMNHVLHFIDNNKLNTFYLGSRPSIYCNRTKYITDNIYKVSAICTHAYIVSRDGMKIFKDLTYFDKPIDKIVSMKPDTYAYLPSLFYQSESPSDISKLKFFGFKEFLLKLNEKYAMYVQLPIVWISSVILLLIAIASLIIFPLYVAAIILLVLIIIFLILLVCYFWKR